MDNEVKQESVAQVIPDPAPEPNQSNEETEDQTDREAYLYEIFAKVHELLVILQQSRAKEVERRRKRDKELARTQRGLHVLNGQIQEALISAPSL